MAFPHKQEKFKKHEDHEILDLYGWFIIFYFMLQKHCYYIILCIANNRSLWKVKTIVIDLSLIQLVHGLIHILHCEKQLIFGDTISCELSTSKS